MTEYDSQNSHSQSIRQDAIALLKKNPLLTAKPLCKLLGLDYRIHRDYLAHIRSKWKYDYKLGLGSKAQFHRARGWVYVDRLGLSREQAKARGWVLSGSKNRALVWKDKVGRMEWFETGRVNLYVREPAVKGRVFQLFCNGFSMTGLIDSWTVLSKVLESIRLKAAHAVFDTGQRLPYLVIDLFKLSSGIVVRSGDLSHPTGIEVEFCYPDWAERNERLLGDLFKAIHGNGFEGKKPDWYVS